MNFEEDVRSGAYETKLSFSGDRAAYRADQGRLTGLFYDDARAFVIRCGVPEKYAAKVVSFAWQQGHSSGFSEVLNYLHMVTEIFT